jgi:hypothetical protein
VSCCAARHVSVPLLSADTPFTDGRPCDVLDPKSGRAIGAFRSLAIALRGFFRLAGGRGDPPTYGPAALFGELRSRTVARHVQAFAPPTNLDGIGTNAGVTRAFVDTSDAFSIIDVSIDIERARYTSIMEHVSNASTNALTCAAATPQNPACHWHFCRVGSPSPPTSG